MSFVPDTPRPRRRPSLTPMIDVVFLLLVFVTLASRFGLDQVFPLPLASGGGSYEGPPRLVEILPEGVRLNGTPLPDAALSAEIAPLTTTPSDLIVLRGADDAPLQRTVTIGALLRAAGFTQLVLIE